MRGYLLAFFYYFMLLFMYRDTHIIYRAVINKVCFAYNVNQKQQ